MGRMMSVVGGCAFIVVAVFGGVFAWNAVKADLRAAVYRERLELLGAEYESLTERYNEAVRRTTVTELVVEGGRLSVRVRSSDGVEREIPTPFDPANEIYVDYVVMDGRLWIRRVFDADTPPSRGLVIEPTFDAGVDWEGSSVAHGKAVYRSLGEGRWQITVTGDGALGLAAAGEGAVVELADRPRVKEYEEIAEEADERVEPLGLGDLWRVVFGGER